jgi:hypothetical protein
MLSNRPRCGEMVADWCALDAAVRVRVTSCWMSLVEADTDGRNGQLGSMRWHRDP